jgi:hypothetical protein
MRALAFAALLLLAGCESSRFTTLPWPEGGAMCADPPSGWWMSTDPDEVDAPTWVHIGDDCTIALANQQTRADGSVEFEAYKLAAAYGKVGSRAILAVPDRDVVAIDADLAGATGGPTNEQGDAGGPSNDQGGKGWHVLEVVPEGNSLRLRHVDHRRLAHAIIDEKLSGSVTRTDTTLANVVTEDAEGVRALLADGATFGGADPLRVDRVDPMKVPDEIAERVLAAKEGKR